MVVPRIVDRGNPLTQKILTTHCIRSCGPIVVAVRSNALREGTLDMLPETTTSHTRCCQAGLQTFMSQGLGGDSPVAARKPSMRLGWYCIRLSLVLAAATRSVTVSAARLPMARRRLDHTPSAGFSSGA